jgi:hypothetical protein
MVGSLYTLKEMVSSLSWSDDPEGTEKLARQLRHWTNVGLLSPVGKRNTGTGVSRLYSVDEVRRAALLVELAHYRIPTTVLESSFSFMSEKWPKDENWLRSIKGTEQIFLCVTYDDRITTFHLVRQDFSASILMPETEKGSFLSKVTKNQLPASAIVVNVTRVFSRLKL